MGLKLTAKQRKAWAMLTDPTIQKVGLFGGKRAGKTDVVAEYFVSRALKFPGSRQLMARKARSHAEESLWSGTLRKYLAAHVPRILYKADEAKLRLTFNNKSVIQIAGLDDKDRTEKTFGNEYITVYLNEATQLAWATAELAFTLAAQVCEDAQGRLSVPKIILDANPRGPRNWVHKVGIQKVDPKTDKPLIDRDAWGTIADWTPYDNIENLSPEYLKSLEALTGTVRERMLKGIWCQDEGLVYDEFNEDNNVCKECKTKPERCPKIEKARTVVAGCDFGFTAPFVWLWAILDGDKRLLIVDEHYKAGLIVEDHAKIIKARKINYSWAVADHDAEDAATLRRHGVLTRPAKKTKPIRASIDLVKARLKVQKDGRSRFRVCQFCTGTTGEAYNYIWHDKKESVPVDENNHALDTARYIVTELDGKGGAGIVMF